MKIEKAPSVLHIFSTCLWIVLAMLASYLLQNRTEIFFLSFSLRPFYFVDLLCHHAKTLFVNSLQ